MIDANGALLGHIAVHNKLISKEQLQQALQLQMVAESKGEAKPLGEILVEQGLISAAVLPKLLAAQKTYLQKQEAKAQQAKKPRSVPGERARAMAASVATPPPKAAGQKRASTSSAAPGGKSELMSILADAIDGGAGDVHLHGGNPVFMRIDGALRSVGGASFESEWVEALVKSVLTPDQVSTLDDKGEVDAAIDLGELGRFRLNAFQHQRGVSATFRHIAARPPTLESLGLPGYLTKLTNYHQGMVLVTGPAGSGKSSTLAALISVVNADRQDHVLCVEDPIEFVHPSLECIVNQRQVERHTDDFASALRGALREDPDVIVIGELRDLETVSLALTAAETGHLVLATLTTTSAIRTVDRLIGIFPPEEQGQVRAMVSESLRAVISQRLVPRKEGGGRVAALEVLMVTKAAGNQIRDGKTFQLQSIMQTGTSQGMRLLDHSLTELVADDLITPAQARRFAEDPSKFVDPPS